MYKDVTCRGTDRFLQLKSNADQIKHLHHLRMLKSYYRAKRVAKINQGEYPYLPVEVMKEVGERWYSG